MEDNAITRKYTYNCAERGIHYININLGIRQIWATIFYKLRGFHALDNSISLINQVKGAGGSSLNSSESTF